ncbi:MAG: glycosyltransferase [Kaiparowitsia implicata GSE-PSE-MK54-09C]|jgi:uncharacterized membrane protein|nr:glycosyltransferase [Kaiparowitsia implicata GSE-PSE-MK54-09C]
MLHKTQIQQRDWLGLGLWVGLGVVLRFANLEAKPLWTDEFSTLVFSLGNSFRAIPLDQVLPLEALLRPLQADPTATLGDVGQRLTQESNHPPLYFMLMHGWLRLWPTSDVTGALEARSLAAVFGSLTIPAFWGLGWVAWRSPTAAHLAAALAAVSPFGVYLAQEARHYTLPTLWGLASLACLLLTVRSLQAAVPLPWWLCLGWVGVNGLGLATHFFVGITLLAEAIALFGWMLYRYGRGDRWKPLVWSRLGLTAVGTLATAAVWLPLWQGMGDSELTQWVYRGDRAGVAWLDPLGQIIGSTLTMLYLLPIQAASDRVQLASIIGLVALLLWTGLWLWRGCWQLSREAETRLTVALLAGVWLGAIALFLLISYGFQRDITSAFRYSFVYYPAVLLLVAGVLAQAWQNASTRGGLWPLWFLLLGRGKGAIVLVLLLGLVGSLCVLTNVAYQKTHRPDLVVQAMQQQYSTPTLVAIAHRSHGQTGRMMGLAVEWQRQVDSAAIQPELAPPLVLLAQDNPARKRAIATLETSLATLPPVLDLWLVNFEQTDGDRLATVLRRAACTEAAPRLRADGYRAQRYRCGESR